MADKLLNFRDYLKAFGKPVSGDPGYEDIQPGESISVLDYFQPEKLKRKQQLISGAEDYTDAYADYVKKANKMLLEAPQAPTLDQFGSSQGGLPAGFLEPQQLPLLSQNEPVGMQPMSRGMVGPPSPIYPTQQEMGTLTDRANEFSLYDPQARLSPAQMTVAEPLLKQSAVLGRGDQQGQIIPTSLASVENRKMSPDEIQAAIDAAQGKPPTRPLPSATVNKIIEEQTKNPPTVQMENIVSQELFGPGMTVDKLTTKEQFTQLYDRLQESKHPVGIHKNAIAKLYGASNYDDLARMKEPLTPDKIRELKEYSHKTGTPIVAEAGLTPLQAADATIYQRGIAFAGAGAGARAEAELKVPAGPEAANYYDVASLQKGRLISAADKDPGITKLDLRKSNTYKFINPNDQQELQQLNNARNTLRELFTRSELILEPTDQLKASTIQPALIWSWAQGGPGSGDVVKDKQGNPVGTKGEIARSFLDQMKSFGGVVARGVLAERGVLTDADRNVAMQAGVNASDTIQTMKQKQQFFEKLMNFQFKAIARLSDNPTGSVADLVKEKEALLKEAQKFPQSKGMPAAQSGGLPSASEIDAELARRQGKK